MPWNHRVAILRDPEGRMVMLAQLSHGERGIREGEHAEDSRAEQLLDLGQSVWLDLHPPRAARVGRVRSPGRASRAWSASRRIPPSSSRRSPEPRLRSGDPGRITRRPRRARRCSRRSAVEDIQHAPATGCAPPTSAPAGVDGRVSIEVSPRLAHDTAGTIAEARRLHAAVARDNVMIKIPATLEGVPAIATLIGEGMSVNVTLIFSLRALPRRSWTPGSRASSARPRAASRSIPMPLGGVVLRVARRQQGGQGDRRRRSRRSSRRRSGARRARVACSGQGGDRQRAARLRRCPRTWSAGPRFAALARARRASAATAVGLDQHQEPGLPRRALRRGADRTRHREHHAAPDARGVQRPRRARGRRIERRPDARPGVVRSAAAARHPDRRA